MTARLRAVVLLAVTAELLALAEIVWVVAFLDQSTDGPAFVMALVAIVVVPTLLAAIIALLVDPLPRRTRIAAVAGVALSGLAAAGVEAGVFVGDDPTDPAFIHWVAAAPLFALVGAMVLAGFAAWGPLRPLPTIARIALTVVVVIVVPIFLAVGLIASLPLVLLSAVSAPIALGAVALVATVRRRRRAEV